MGALPGSLISFSTFCFLFPYLLQRLQGLLPLNPMHFSTGQAPMNATPMTPDLAFNTAVSFMTNTNWQSYSPDTTLSYLVQMAALAVQNFVSAAVGIAVAVAMIRGFARHTSKTIGNFWADLTRCTLYILLPISIVAALFFVWQGSIQNFKGPDTVQTVEGTPQTIEQGPLASQLAIKMLGTNGGGYFNANSAHPYENPTPLSNLHTDVADLRPRRRVDLQVWKDGPRYAAGLGDIRDHECAFPGRGRHLLLGRAKRKSR